jgi:hypothetical protein
MENTFITTIMMKKDDHDEEGHHEEDNHDEEGHHEEDNS